MALLFAISQQTIVCSTNEARIFEFECPSPTFLITVCVHMHVIFANFQISTCLTTSEMRGRKSNGGQQKLLVPWPSRRAPGDLSLVSDASNAVVSNTANRAAGQISKGCCFPCFISTLRLATQHSEKAKIEILIERSTSHSGNHCLIRAWGGPLDTKLSKSEIGTQHSQAVVRGRNVGPDISCKPRIFHHDQSGGLTVVPPVIA